MLAYYLILLAIALVPLFMVDILVTGDTPNHLARAYILSALDTDPNLQNYYAVEWRLFSFQSVDLILPSLVKIFGVSAGTQIFMVAAFVLLIGGALAVHGAFFGRVGLWPSLVFLFLYARPLAYGQISFLFSTGLSLLLFAAWIATSRHRHALRIIAFTVATFVLMLCHFFAFASYAVMIATFELSRLGLRGDFTRKFRALCVAGIPFAIPVVCYGLTFATAIHGDKVYGVSEATLAPDLIFRLISMLGATIAFVDWIDLVMTASVAVILWLIDRGRLFTFAPGMRLTVFVLLALAILMPNMLFGVTGADLRIPYLLAFLLVAASDVAWRSRRQATVFGAGVVALMLLRVVTVTEQFQKLDADYAEFRAAAAELEPGSRVLHLPIKKDRRADPQPLLPYNFVGAAAVIDRQVFLPRLYIFGTPLEFANAGTTVLSDQLARTRITRWQPTASAFAAVDPETVRQVDELSHLMSTRDLPTSYIDWSAWPEQYDYAIDLNFGQYENPVPALLEEIRRGSYFSIYRIHPPK